MINNESINAFEIAALAGFARNCNLINSQQFDKIISSGAKKLDPSIFVVSETPDWIFYDKLGFSAFKTAIEATALKIFFRLMNKDSVFSSKMAGNIVNLNTGLLNAESFKQLIIDELSDVIDEIAVRISNGENLTGSEIEDLLENGVKSKENEIKEGGEKLSGIKSNDPSGISTIFSDTALQQKIKGLRWRPIKGASISPKQLQRIKKSTENIKKQIEKAKGGLQTAKSIVQLLKKLESIYSNGLIGIVQSVLKIVFSFVRDIGSSGVYVLDMTSPYTYNSFNEIDPDNSKDKKERSARMKELLKRKIEKESVQSTYVHMNNDLVNSTPFLSDWVNPSSNFPKTSKTIETLETIVSSIYKPTTYASFIQIIADAFMDDGDVPRYGIADTLYYKSDDGQKKLVLPSPDPLPSKKRTERGIINMLSGGKADIARPGRPIFGKGSNATVTIVAFSIPNIFSMANLTLGIVKSFIMLLSFFGVDAKSPEARKLISDSNPFMKRIKRMMSKVVNKFNKASSNKLYDYYNNKPEVEVTTGPDGETIESITVNAGLTSQDPDFYGISVRGIFSGFFDSLDKLESISNSFLTDFKSSLVKELENLLKNIEEFIDDLEDFLDVLDAIISFFETLQTMGLYTLNFTSNGGNEDIVEKLLAAEGFPGVDEGDKLRLIGGMVFCYGIPNPNPGKIDFSGLIKQKMAAVDYEAAVAKFESSGNSNDDPGSFEDYINSEGIGNNYTSSLDKIFKKLF